ncbi:indole-3-glycerol phosphate synthase TrpC [Subsaximicrobium wynnwilliamsii]|jgi:indole-3-glycerol phosphate synthase|uniref:Indole-3-glycerol phosphate synthase n=1 Tax=Subsaximicrobium wynnwilliamsii TaxID=291179 RepID=A0A5C6ZC36_9FLAO|nr:indole-3-glycerol phosphate synthase TrpC [Subsaximicrobium wynnwilliamsii]TXD81779.1 indole-3-glycerol phosphate synthase TrpC [Subsaximicrobium wynnwilliamsii]TXD87605.1 indole-3-glycerol phosphate synthase TrpC [Subsaximicrobium wynnwilliamsii]TXE01278.1 indole-3-glycerol phosphate synthase TrpC [Subsaximicrobium wynnwilliamsii]
MDILEQIVKDKHKEVALKKEFIPIKAFEQLPYFTRQTLSLAQRVRDNDPGIIAEFKRKSPSKSWINETADIESIAEGYEEAGVSGMSVLTDEIHFGGTMDDLLMARENCNLPILRKEFIIDEYQIIEAKAIGADAILLIASILTKAEIKAFSELAKSLQLEVLLEVHNEAELQKSIMPSLDLLGVNNRNLKTFEVSLETSKRLSQLIPDYFVKVSESGISSIDAIKSLQPYGYKGFLIGENFMKTKDPGKSAAAFIKALASI